VDGNIKLKLIDFTGGQYWDKTFAINLPINSVSNVFSIEVPALLKNLKEGDAVFQALLQVDGQQVAKNHIYFTLTKDLNLPIPDYHLEFTKIQTGYRIQLTAKNLLKNVYLHLDEFEGVFSDNYFDLLPGEPITVEYATSQKIENFRDKLKIQTLEETYS
jgi:beta-mannosidase